MRGTRVVGIAASVFLWGGLLVVGPPPPAGADTALWKALRFLQAGGLTQNTLTDSAALRRALECHSGQTQGDDAHDERDDPEAGAHFLRVRPPPFGVGRHA